MSPAPPANTALPVISGTTQQGQSLSTSNGSWSGSPTSYGYQWSRCDSSGANCAPINGATGSSYTLAAADVNSTIRVTVTATNAGGSTSASSNPSATITAPPAPPRDLQHPDGQAQRPVPRRLRGLAGQWCAGGAVDL